jgi:hypothetical protein
MRSVTADGDTTRGTTKFKEFESYVASYDFDIIGITETWLGESIDSESITLKHFLTPIRKDRNRHGGGICVYIDEDFPANRVLELEPDTIEAICIEYFINKKKHLLCYAYRAPDFDIVDFLLGIEYILSHCAGYNDIIFMGDFNCKHSSFCSNDLTTSDGRAIKAYFDSKEFTQMINEPTRFQNEHCTCLDLIFTNNPINTRSVSVHPQINNCDHCPITIQLTQNIPTYKAYKRMVWDFKRGNYVILRNLLATDTRWNSVFSKDNINDMTCEFMDIFEKVCESCVPHYEVIVRPNCKPYITTEIKRLIRRRDRLHKAHKTHKTETTRTNYKHARNEVVSKIRRSFLDYEANQLDVLNNRMLNPKSFWKTLKSKYNTTLKPTIPPLLHNNILIADPIQKAELFNNFFVSQTVLDDRSTFLPPNYPSVRSSIQHINITEFHTFKVLANLDPSKATGPDGIGNKLLKEAAPAICGPLSKLFQKSIDMGIYPDMWKVANITSLHKKGSVYDCNNYRPISLLPCISKVFEKLVFNHIYSYLTRSNLISSHQSGFRPGDSTVKQLVSICHNISQALDDGDEMLSVFLDFKKAFDKVWHKGLIFKLKQIGVTGSILNWLENYLSHRKQCVVIQGHKSTYLHIYAGIPQGSVLGPLLFLIYINDICNDLKSMVPAMACTGEHREVRIHADIQKNVPTPIVPVLFDNAILQNVLYHKHLGLWIDTKLTWSYLSRRASLCYCIQTAKYDAPIEI